MSIATVARKPGRPALNGHPSRPHLKALDGARAHLIQVAMQTPKTDRECTDMVASLTRASNELEHRLRMQAIVRKNKG
jgi:hypothetical protein